MVNAVDDHHINGRALVLGPKGPTLTKSSGDPNELPSLFFRGLGLLPAINVSMTDGDGGTLNGVFRSIDQSPQGVSVSALALEGATVKYAMPALGATYDRITFLIAGSRGEVTATPL
jgi:hypothetical protein